MKIHYILCGLTRTYKKVIPKLNKIFSKYHIKYYIMDDQSLNDYFDKAVFKNKENISYHIIDFNLDEFKEHIIKKYGKQYKYVSYDIQFYKVYKLINSINDYQDGDIIIRGRTDSFPVFNNSALIDKNIPWNGRKKIKGEEKGDIIIDNNYSLENLDINKYLYYIGPEYNKHPYKHMHDGFFIGNINNIKVLGEAGIKYNAQYSNPSWPWKNGNPPEAQLLINLLDSDIILKAIYHYSHHIKIFY